MFRSTKSAAIPFAKPLFMQPGRAGFVAGLFVLLAACLSDFFLYRQSVAALRDELRHSLRREAAALSTLVDADAHKRFVSPAQESSAEYARALAPLRRVLQSRDKEIKYIYTCVLRPDPLGVKRVYFVLDTAPAGDHDGDGVDDKSHIRQPYPEASPELFRALETGTAQSDAEPYKDAWGTFISGYAPFRDRNNRVAGVLGIDMPATAYLDHIFALRAAALAGIGIGLVVSLAVGLVVRRLFIGIVAARTALEERVRERTVELAQANAVLQNEVAERERAMKALQASEEHLAHQAFHDALTGLPNRSLFVDRLQNALAHTARRDSFVAVLFMDLNDFKIVNDSLGHDAGDSLLKFVAERLRACLRPGDTIARLGGDEFTILLEEISYVGEARLVAERVVEQLRTPVLLEGREVFTSASIGIAISREHDSNDKASLDRILRDADTAMYQAKARGAGGTHCVVFDNHMNQDMMARLELEADLRRALASDELKVFYQPIFCLENDQITELEALVRWQHSTRGLISPAHFIPIAEETGMIVPIGKRVLELACAQVGAWQKRHPQHPPLIVSVNVSGRQLQDDDFVDEVERVLRETGLPPNCLKIELTESVMMVDTAATIAKLYTLKDLGVRLAVDDFGTGYSSMAYLSHFPLDTLKIDRSFVSRLGGRHKEDGAIVHAIVTLAKALNLGVIGEGVETETQLAYLNSIGCDHAQGYWFAHPLPAPALENLLRERAAPLRALVAAG